MGLADKILEKLQGEECHGQPNHRAMEGKMRFLMILVTLILILVFIPFDSAFAVRPFITDDARVTPAHTFLTETSLRLDENRFQNLTLFGLGFTDKLEGTIGFTDGILLKDEEGTAYQFSIAGPLLQLKYLFNEQKGKHGIPAFGIAAGVNPPWGLGSTNFPPQSWSEFCFLLMSKAFSSHPEHFNLHVNLGATNTHNPDGKMSQEVTWGIGIQYHLFRDVIYGITEVVSGDPYGVSAGATYQVGLRFFISKQMQLDASYGAGIWGDPRPGWFLGFGFRFFTDPLW